MNLRLVNPWVAVTVGYGWTLAPRALAAGDCLGPAAHGAVTVPPEYWLPVLAIAVTYALLSRGDEKTALGELSPLSRRAWVELGVLSVAVFAFRLALALPRGLTRSVDEFQYLAAAQFARASGESALFSLLGLRGQLLLYELGGDHALAFVDVMASLAVGLTCFLLGAWVYRAIGSRAVGLLTPLMYFVGMVPFEGLSANSEVFLNLFLALYLTVRLRPDLSPLSMRRSLLAGAALGLACAAKEQAAPFVLCEPILWTFIAKRHGAFGWKAFLRHQGVAALGFLIPVGVLALGYLHYGQLGAVIDLYTLAGSSQGSAYKSSIPNLIQGYPELSGPPLRGAWPMLYLKVTAIELAPLIANVAGYAGLSALVLLARPYAERLVVAGLGLMTLVGLGAISLGFRWFPHYFMILFPALAPLASILVVRVARALVPDPAAGASKKRLGAAMMLLGVLLAAALEVAYLRALPVRALGYGVSAQRQEILSEISEQVRALTASESRLLVAGYRPELYYTCGRVPATRAVVGGMLWLSRWSVVAADLRKHRPAAVVVPTQLGIQYSVVTIDRARGRVVLRIPRDEFGNDPRFRAWLDAGGYQLVRSRSEYQLYVLGE
jgi:hypothetical protein